MKKLILTFILIGLASCVQHKSESNPTLPNGEKADASNIKTNKSENTGSLFNFSLLVGNQNAKYNDTYNLLAFNNSGANIITGDGKSNNLLSKCDYYFSSFLGFDKTKEYGIFRGHPSWGGAYELAVLPLRDLNAGKCNVIQTVYAGDGITVQNVTDGFVVSQFGSAQYWKFADGKLIEGTSSSICPFGNKKDCVGNRIGSVHASWFTFEDYLIAFESDFYYSNNESHYFEVWQLKDGKVLNREQINDYRSYEVTRDVNNIPSSSKMLWMNTFINATMQACLKNSATATVPECLRTLVKMKIPENHTYAYVPVTGTRYMLYNQSTDKQSHIWDLIKGEELINPVLSAQIVTMSRSYWLEMSETEFIRPLQNEKISIDVSNLTTPFKTEPSEYTYILPEDGVGFVRTSQDKENRVFELKKLN